MKLLLPVLCLALLAGCSPRDKATAAAAPAPVGPVHTKGAEPIRIAHGQQVALADYLVPGKTTVFDFTSEFCPPCRAYEEPLLALHRQRADIAIIKVDVNRPGLSRIDWESPVVQQYKMQSIPHFKVYGPDGKLVAEDKLVVGPDGNVLEQDSSGRTMVNKWLEELK